MCRFKFCAQSKAVCGLALFNVILLVSTRTRPAAASGHCARAIFDSRHTPSGVGVGARTRWPRGRPHVRVACERERRCERHNTRHRDNKWRNPGGRGARGSCRGEEIRASVGQGDAMTRRRHAALLRMRNATYLERAGCAVSIFVFHGAACCGRVRRRVRAPLDTWRHARRRETQLGTYSDDGMWGMVQRSRMSTAGLWRAP